jgi:hypothetical protein
MSANSCMERETFGREKNEIVRGTKEPLRERVTNKRTRTVNKRDNDNLSEISHKSY